MNKKKKQIFTILQNVILFYGFRTFAAGPWRIKRKKKRDSCGGSGYILKYYYVSTAWLGVFALFEKKTNNKMFNVCSAFGRTDGGIDRGELSSHIGANERNVVKIVSEDNARWTEPNKRMILVA